MHIKDSGSFLNPSLEFEQNVPNLTKMCQIKFDN